MKQSKKYMIVSLVSNTLLSTAKILTGFFVASGAILSDGIHSLSDLLTDIVAIYGIEKCHQKEDDEHPLGHGNFEYIASMLLGVIILFFAYELFMAMLNRQNSVPNIFGMYIVLGTIIIKVFLSRFLIKKGEKLDNQILRASGHESMNDVYSSIVVIIGLVLSQFDFSFSIYIDKITSILIILLIAKTGILTIKESANYLLGKNADSKSLENLKNELIKEIDEVENIDKFILLKQGPFYKAIIDVEIDPKTSVEEGHNIGGKVKQVLMKDEKINYVKVHIEPYYKKD